MEPETFRASPLLGPVIGGMLGVIYLFIIGLPMLTETASDDFGTGVIIIFGVTWGLVTLLFTAIGMRIVLRVDETGVTVRGRKLAWRDIASIEREDRVIGYTGYNSSTGITQRQTRHDLVIFKPKLSGVHALQINAALMNSGADALAERMRAHLERFGDPASGKAPG